MQYIIMCGGKYEKWKIPRQLLPINGEPIVARTIRLLIDAGVSKNDIFISSNYPDFEKYAPVLYHTNKYEGYRNGDNNGFWTDCFYETKTPICYIFGDVVFSPEAIRTIVETETDDIQFFASAPPFTKDYIKPWAEPFALKVVNQTHLQSAIRMTELFYKQGRFKRKPIMWELWQVITIHKLNDIDYSSYIHINDYTCDVDSPEDLKKIEQYVPYTIRSENIV